MAAFEYRQAEEIRDVLRKHGVRYLFIGKSGAILLGFPDTTQDADLFVEHQSAERSGISSPLAFLPRVLAQKSQLLDALRYVFDLENRAA